MISDAWPRPSISFLLALILSSAAGCVSNVPATPNAKPLGQFELITARDYSGHLALESSGRFEISLRYPGSVAASDSVGITLRGTYFLRDPNRLAFVITRSSATLRDARQSSLLAEQATGWWAPDTVVVVLNRDSLAFRRVVGGGG